jgi:Mg2+ and Co2+ transporter CorA
MAQMPFLHTRFMKDIELERGVGDAGRAAVQSFLAQWQYCRSNSLKPFDIHQPLPLDEYCRSVIFERKPELRRERMRDQVLAHYRSSLASKLDYAPIVVSQAWIWKIEDILITGPQQYIFGNGSDRDNSILARDNIEDTSGRTIGLAWSLPSTIGLKLSYLISTFNDRVDTAEGRPREKTLDGYEKAIALIFEQANAYSKLRGVEAIDVDTEGDILHRINDVRDELSMIKRVLNQQEEVWREFASSAWPSYWPDGRDGRMKVPIDELYNSERSQIWRQILRPQTQFREFERRIAQLDEDAERIEKSINSKLDLKTKKATLDETHATSLMSAAVFGFTIITIIFTPLSFVVALFALPIDMFQREQIQSRWTDEAGMFTKQYIGTWVGEYRRSYAFQCITDNLLFSHRRSCLGRLRLFLHVGSCKTQSGLFNQEVHREEEGKAT